MVFVNSKSLSSLKIDDTPVDDPSLKVLVANNSDTLKLLKMSSCPHVSPAGTMAAKTAAQFFLSLLTNVQSSILCLYIYTPIFTFQSMFYISFKYMDGNEEQCFSPVVNCHVFRNS